MKKASVIITLLTLFAVFYSIAPFVDLSDKLIFGMFLVLPFLVLYIAYFILKHGKPSGYTFNNRYYDDLEDEAE